MTTPAETVTALARRFRLEVNLGTAEAKNWSLIPGMREFQPTYTPVIQDDRDYDDEGAPRQVKTAYDWGLTCKFSHRTHPDTGAWNAAQEKLRLASESFGDDSYVEVRWFDRDGRDEAYQGLVLVTWTPDGGDPTATDVVSAALAGHGERERITNPLLEEEE